MNDVALAQEIVAFRLNGEDAILLTCWIIAVCFSGFDGPTEKPNCHDDQEEGADQVKDRHPGLRSRGMVWCGSVTEHDGGRDPDRECRSERAEVEPHARVERPLAEYEREHRPHERQRREHRRQRDNDELYVDPVHELSAPPISGRA